MRHHVLNFNRDILLDIPCETYFGYKFGMNKVGKIKGRATTQSDKDEG